MRVAFPCPSPWNGVWNGVCGWHFLQQEKIDENFSTLHMEKCRKFISGKLPGRHQHHQSFSLTNTLTNHAFPECVFQRFSFSQHDFPHRQKKAFRLSSGFNGERRSFKNFLFSFFWSNAAENRIKNIDRPSVEETRRKFRNWNLNFPELESFKWENDEDGIAWASTVTVVKLIKSELPHRTLPIRFIKFNSRASSSSSARTVRAKPSSLNHKILSELRRTECKKGEEKEAKGRASRPL